jgi:TATA-box binding protein (TBP) (component of TFIID and TFIIIB)
MVINDLGGLSLFVVYALFQIEIVLLTFMTGRLVVGEVNDP